LDTGRRRPEWMWIALRGERLVARAAWWARPHTDTPDCLDVFDLDGDEPEPVEVGVRLLETAMAEVVPGRRRDSPLHLPPGRSGEASVRGRIAALERTGARRFVERLRLEWRPGTPIPEPAGRLTFGSAGNTAELIDLMTAVLHG